MMVSLQVLVIVYLNSLFSLCLAANPGCVCNVYQSEPGVTYEGHGGIFQSPDYPSVYPPNSNCFLYTFIGDIGEIVQLTFLTFDLQMPQNTRCEDFVSFYTNLERGEVNEHDHPDYKLCGNMEMIQKVHYSSGRALVLEFHTDSIRGKNKGFQGRYKFLDKNNFHTNGEVYKLSRTQWTYTFHSSNRTKKGRFFSPLYPQHYPADAECQYIFKGLPEERVVINFENIQLERLVGRCSASPDVIIVRDGINSSSPVIVQHCDTRNNREHMSSGPNLYIEFLADSKNQRQGFAATYTFMNSEQVKQFTKDRMKDDLPTLSPENPVTNCNQVIVSSRSKNGTISSPNYPNTYPSYVSCGYTFQGQGKERVQIEFKYFDLYYTHSDKGNPSDCQGVDSVKVATYINNEKTDLGTYCGGKIPPMLMSSDLQLSLKFTSDSTAVGVRGFEARYSFLTNFGITGHMQDPHSVCGFIFKQDKRLKHTQNGTFTSPNYPGLYPRNTECQYLFYGEKNYRVHIKFLDFNVEGMLKECAESSYSDYVEFSNFANNVKDKKLRRYCGVRMNQIHDVVSDGEFFRVTFKSNNIYDATGFKARYEFKLYDDRVKVYGRGPSESKDGSDPTLGEHKTPSTASTCTPGLFSIVCILLVALINS